MKGFLKIYKFLKTHHLRIERSQLLIYDAWKSAKSRKYVIKVILSGKNYANIRIFSHVICFKKRNMSTIKQRICSSSCNNRATVLITVIQFITSGLSMYHKMR